MSLRLVPLKILKHSSKLKGIETRRVKNIQRQSIFKSKSQENSIYCTENMQMDSGEKCQSLDFQSVVNPISHFFDDKTSSKSSNDTHSTFTELNFCNINNSMTHNNQKIVNSSKEEIMKPDKNEKVCQFFGLENVQEFIKGEKNKSMTESVQYNNSDKIQNIASETCLQSTLKREYVSYTEKKTEIKSRSMLTKHMTVVPTSKPNSQLRQPYANDNRLKSLTYNRKELRLRHKPIELANKEQVSFDHQQFQNSLQQNCILQQHIVYKSQQSCKMQHSKANNRHLDKPSTSPRPIKPTKTPIKSSYVKLDHKCPISSPRKFLFDLNLSERKASFMFLPIYFVLKSIIRFLLCLSSILDSFQRYFFACLSLIFGLPTTIYKKIKDSFNNKKNETTKQKIKYRTRENSRLLLHKLPRNDFAK